MEILNNFLTACQSLLTIKGIIFLLFSSTLGVIVGALPGLTATLGIVLLTGLTFTLKTLDALTVLIGVYVGAIYGGSITAITINVPGTGSAAATCLDGYPLALKGRAAFTIKLTRAASIFGTLFGMICLIAFTPLITKFALQFTSAEFFLLALFGVLICGSISATDLSVKGWAAGIIGIFISLIGIDQIQSIEILTFNFTSLMSGINPIPAMIGFFAIPQILKTLTSEMTNQEVTGLETKDNFLSTLIELKKNKLLILRSSLIGVGIGALPGVGENIAAWLAYDQARKSSKTPELFGTGHLEGVIAPEVANNAAIGGACIPLLSLAIPGSPPTAVLLGALLLHGIRPGPMLAIEFPMFTYELGALLFFSSIALWIVGIALSKPISKIIEIPYGLLMPVVGILCVIGAYSLNLSMFDLKVMFFFGIIGFALEKMGYPAASIVLGMLLGRLLDENFRRALLVSGGSISPFIFRPIALLFLLATLYTVISPFISKKAAKKYTDLAKNTSD